MNTRTTRVSYWPEGCNPDDREARHFQVDVEWAGPMTPGPRSVGGWKVCHGPSQLSRKGNWTFYPQRFQLWQHRWSTIEEAQEWAAKVVNDVKVNGHTWSQWQEIHAATQAQS